MQCCIDCYFFWNRLHAERGILLSEFNHFARTLDEQAHDSFTAYTSAVISYRTAKAEADMYPLSAKAQANLAGAKTAYRLARRTFQTSTTQFTGLREQLSEAITAAYSATPDELDVNTLELLKSGILTASEYNRLLEQVATANNSTMCRVIERCAREAAEQRASRYGEDDRQARALRAVCYKARAFTGADKLELFDDLLDVYHRCTTNPAMIARWDALTHDYVADF